LGELLLLLRLSLLIVAALGSILFCAATPAKAAGVNAFGGPLLPLFKRQFPLDRLREVVQKY
jgi:TRAP-type mannitol/chloroaromatic compound transport system permease large subunit|tara:strand:+ start:185 stop:370 length:186 start_codon:yes stop_codon:yes gene_type:complete